MGKQIGIGFVGVGNISEIYLKNITNLFEEIYIAGVCDLVPEKAEKAREKYGVKVYKDMYELFEDENVDIVLNITEPANHYPVTMAALKAGKHVYSEKPLATRFEDGVEICKYAKEHNLFVGGAPDTFMGAGLQTTRKLVDEGAIGKPFGGNVRFVCQGPERWHPNPAFFYQFGAGPLFDMGPYYVTSLVNIFGRAKSVVAVCTKALEEKIATCKEIYGESIKIEVPTYVNGIVTFDSGAQVSVTISFDVFDSNGGAPIEIYGTEGTIYAPDPNTFCGPVRLLKQGGDVVEMPLEFGYSENSRALGLADMAKAISCGRDYRACSMQQLHVLEIMCAFYKASDEHREITLTTPFERKPLMDNTCPCGVLEI